ncbi:uncharacterized protein LOC133908405 [Phragmites australis]|uniref:uncharacterized protein LOC133908405 n=1 Tax=Phragmites australis TaxID=29695 RepID=UPI002D785E3E|nr:uncharacterized protein LOC133908405 [Phragmites australis]
MAPSWSDLPSELLGVVLLHLPCLADRVYFAAVCRSWRFAAAGRVLVPAPQLPWLLLLPSADAPSFVSLLAGFTRRRLSLPDGARDARHCGSHEGGWFAVAADGWRRYELVNLFSRARIPLPERLRVPILGIVSCVIVRAVALSAPPTSPGCLAAALVCGASNLAFLRPGLDTHWMASETVDRLQDILYHEGEVLRGFHAVTDYEAVTVFTQGGAPGAAALMMASRSYRMQRRPGASSAGVSRYLVESRGKLLMVVRRFPSVEHGSSASTMPRQNRRFDILEMTVQAQPHGRHTASWEDLDGGLDGRVLFLARGCSRAFEASQFSGFQEGVYFLDDTSFDISLALSSGGNFPCSDIGWYSDRQITRGIKGFPSEFQSNCSSPAWVYP